MDKPSTQEQHLQTMLRHTPRGQYAFPLILLCMGSECDKHQFTWPCEPYKNAVDKLQRYLKKMAKEV